MTDPDLQKLIDAKKAVEQRKLDDAEIRRIAGIKANEEKVQADVEWKDILFIANEEAGRINSISAQTGIKIAGRNVTPGTVGLTYRFSREKTALEIDVEFSRSGNQIQVKISPTKIIPALAHLRWTKHFPSAKGVNVRAMFSDIARDMIEV